VGEENQQFSQKSPSKRGARKSLLSRSKRERGISESKSQGEPSLAHVHSQGSSSTARPGPKKEKRVSDEGWRKPENATGAVICGEMRSDDCADL